MLRSHSSVEAEAMNAGAEASLHGRTPCFESPVAPTGCFASVIPPGFLRLDQRVQQRIDRALGYFGQQRFVFFYFEPRGEEVVWNDGNSYGFATGAWVTFDRKILPLARSHGANLNQTGGQGEHVLLIDRMTGQAYFAPRQSAEEFVTSRPASPA